MLARMTETAPVRVFESKDELWSRGSRYGASEKLAVGECLWREGQLHHPAGLRGRAGRACAARALQGIELGRRAQSDPAARLAGVSACDIFIKGNHNTNYNTQAEWGAATC